MINYFIVPDPSDSDDDDDYCRDGPSPAIADPGNKNGLPERVTRTGVYYRCVPIYNIYVYILF